MLHGTVLTLSLQQICTADISIRSQSVNIQVTQYGYDTCITLSPRSTATDTHHLHAAVFIKGAWQIGSHFHGDYLHSLTLEVVLPDKPFTAHDGCSTAV